MSLGWEPNGKHVQMPPEITERIEDVSSYVTLRAMADTAVAYSAGVLILTNYRLVFVTELRLQRVDLGFHVGAEFNHEVGQRTRLVIRAHTEIRVWPVHFAHRLPRTHACAITRLGLACLPIHQPNHTMATPRPCAPAADLHDGVCTCLPQVDLTTQVAIGNIREVEWELVPNLFGEGPEMPSLRVRCNWGKELLFVFRTKPLEDPDSSLAKSGGGSGVVRSPRALLRALSNGGNGAADLDEPPVPPSLSPSANAPASMLPSAAGLSAASEATAASSGDGSRVDDGSGADGGGAGARVEADGAGGDEGADDGSRPMMRRDDRVKSDRGSGSTFKPRKFRQSVKTSKMLRCSTYY